MVIMPEKKKTAEKGAKDNGSAATKGRPQTPVIVGKFPFKIDTAGIIFKRVGRSKTTTNGIVYESGRITVPKEWIDKDVIVMIIDGDDNTNRKSIDKIQNGDNEPREA